MVELDKKQLLRDVGSNLRIVRQMRNLTQEQLAEKIGVTQVQIARIESGAVNPTLATFVSIIRGLEVSADKVLGSRLENEL